MSSNRELAEAYLEDAEYTLEEARGALERGYYHRAVRRAQECVELCLKAVLSCTGSSTRRPTTSAPCWSG